MLTHNRKFVPGGVALVTGRVKNDGKTLKRIQDNIESLIINSDFLKGSLFRWIGLIYRYGKKTDLKVEFKKINKTYESLPIALELDMEILEWADKYNLELLHDIFMIAALEALIQVGQKYKLPIEPFVTERTKYGQIPNNIFECTRYKNT